MKEAGRDKESEISGRRWEVGGGRKEEVEGGRREGVEDRGVGREENGREKRRG